MFVAMVALGACGADDTPAAIADGGVALDAAPNPDCDPLDPTACALPWPSSLYLQADPATATGVRVRFAATALPANGDGVRISPEPFADLDGYGLGTPIIVGFGPLDYAPLADEWTNLARSVEASSPSLLLRVTATGLERMPHFVEPDRNAPDATRLTYLRPAVILEPSTRYVVAFRGLRRPDGTPVAPSTAFAALRDGTVTADPALEARRPQFDEMFARLEEAGVARGELLLAWEFVTGSEANIHARLDRAISLALARAPSGGTLDLDTVERFAPSADASGDRVDAEIRYTISGTLRRPTVLRRPASGMGWELVTDAAGDVALADTDTTTRVLVQVPHSALGGEAAGVIVYGHGQFGSEGEIYADHLKRLAQDFRYVLVAVPMVGMSQDEFEPVTIALGDLNLAGTLTDGLVQGILDHHLIVRVARSSLAAALTAIDPEIDIDADYVSYFGGSQGGIYGQTILATSPDLERAVLAVLGNNYNTLLQRSANFAPFESLLGRGYRRNVDRAVALAALQLNWDRTDPVSYVGRMLRPAGSAPARRALMLLAKGDRQVAVVTNEIAARTHPDTLRVLANYDDRLPFGLVETPYPLDGSGIVLFDFGNAWPSDRGNLAPMSDLPDPHSRIAEIEEAGTMLDTFLRAGRIIDVCGGDGCNPR